MENQEKTAEEMQTKKWFGMVLIVAGIYFCATGLSGAVFPIMEHGMGMLTAMEIFAGAIGIAGIACVIGGSVLFLKAEGKKNRKKETDL